MTAKGSAGRDAGGGGRRRGALGTREDLGTCTHARGTACKEGGGWKGKTTCRRYAKKMENNVFTKKGGIGSEFEQKGGNARITIELFRGRQTHEEGSTDIPTSRFPKINRKLSE